MLSSNLKPLPVFASLLLLLLMPPLCSSVLFRLRPPGNENTSGSQFTSSPYITLPHTPYRNQQSNLDPHKRHCLSYNPLKNICAKCLEGYSLDRGEKRCKKNLSPDQPTPPAPNINPTTPTLDLISSISLTSLFFCQTIHLSTCLKCFPGFTLHPTLSTCIEDESSFTPLQIDYMLSPPSPSHSLCSSFTPSGHCLTCLPGTTFSPTLSDCLLPSQTLHDCTLHQTCYPITTYCDLYSSDMSCKTCPEGAVNVHGVCRREERRDLCVRYGEWRVCEECMEGSVRVGERGACRYVTPNCGRWERGAGRGEGGGERGGCVECKVGFLLRGGDCVLVAPVLWRRKDVNCYTWREGECVMCKFGYGFEGGRCVEKAGERGVDRVETP